MECRTQFFVLDILTRAWDSIADMPLGSQRQYACIFKGPNCFYVFGGDGIGGSLNSMYKYSIHSNSWSQVASKPGNGLIGASCFEFGDKIIISGGKFYGEGPVSNEVWEYSMSRDTWLRKKDVPYAGRWRAGSTVLNQKGYVIFGRDNNESLRKELYSYSPQADEWTKVMDYPHSNGRAYSSLQCLNDKLILFGGYDTLGTFYNEAWLYDATASNWSQTNTLPSLGRKGGMFCVAGNTYMYSCGIIKLDARIKETWLFELPYDIKDNESKTVFSAWPNPAHEQLTIQFPNKFAFEKFKYTLSNSHGQEIQNATFENSLFAPYTIDLNFLSEGVYFLKLFLANELIEVKKIVKN
jgi:N-acetylneuraminic acid mutarotase